MKKYWVEIFRGKIEYSQQLLNYKCSIYSMVVNSFWDMFGREVFVLNDDTMCRSKLFIACILLGIYDLNIYVVFSL